MKLFAGALVLASVLACDADAGGVESHPIQIVLTRVGEASPFTVMVADPVPMFDDKGGTRRLGKIRLAFGLTWEATIMLKNRLPERQCVEYSNYSVEAWLDVPALENVFAEVPNGVASGRMGADPGESVTRSFAMGGGGGIYQWVYREGSLINYYIGRGSIALECDPRGGFDTFRVVDGDQNCNGGYWSGGPQGFEQPLMRFSWNCTWEYHWIDGSCPVDLTTLNNNSHPMYRYGQPDGIVDNEDFFYYLDQFAAGNLAVADMTNTAVPGSPGYGVPNGILSNDDFFYFLSEFAQGC